ncbi:ABC transporter permease [Micromonospora mirobrigensis]|uniref:ABC-2 type transport system permease protein n=1 Tax=Micromonospora mirobrigensis TaxID=262898 RepID=A0A1C5A7Q4_9ACTN|nr:ABC transporter permease [Micromonospora mirobrigensis]SCF41225.1 ABC-2 type transport system permease protein [Micromonospora mirobrigensis]
MRAYLRFELRRLVRDPRLAFFSIIGPVTTYVIFSGWSAGDRLEGLGAPVAVMIGLAGYGAVAGVLMVGAAVAQERAAGWLHQLRVTPLPPGGVVAVKALTGSLTAIPPVIAVGAAASIQHHVQLPAGRWIGLLLLMWVGTVPFTLLGLAIGYGLAPQVAVPVNFLVFLVLSVLGGLLAPTAYFPGVLRDLAHALPTYRYAELGWRSAAGHPPSVSGLAVLVAWTALFAVVATWAYRRSTAGR